MRRKKAVLPGAQLVPAWSWSWEPRAAVPLCGAQLGSAFRRACSRGGAFSFVTRFPDAGAHLSVDRADASRLGGMLEPQNRRQVSAEEAPHLLDQPAASFLSPGLSH